MTKKIINKQAKKKLDNECVFCGEKMYEVLDVHRIIAGENGGKYTQQNSISSCSNCHRKCHSGKIKIDKKYQTTTGEWLLHFWEEDKENWKKLKFG